MSSISSASTPAIDGEVDQVYVQAWDDPLIDGLGHDPRSTYVEQFWLGILGPSTIWLLRHCVHELDRSPGGFVLDLAETAGALGLGHKGGRNSALARSMTRACRFGAARPRGVGELEIRRRLPPLNRGQLSRLPDVLQRRHDRFLDAETSMDPADLTRRARRLALGLVECGDALDAAERQLGQWRFHPSVAADAVRWAWECHHASQKAASTATVGGTFASG
ncbi:MAG: hypothetical protein AAF548_04970 [Actinomycetota bacterium]